MSANWHPLTWLSLMLDATLFGKGPAGPHSRTCCFISPMSSCCFCCLPASDGDAGGARCGGPVCPASAARGIGGVDFGAQGCFEHVFRAAHFWRMRARGRSGERENWRGHRTSNIEHRTSKGYWLAFVFFRAGSDEQTDAGDAAVCDVVAGLLAVGEIYDLGFTIYDFTSGSGKDSVLHALSAVSCVVTFMAQQKGGAVAALARYFISARVWKTPLFPMPGIWVKPSGRSARQSVSVCGTLAVDCWLLSAAALFIGLCASPVWLATPISLCRHRLVLVCRDAGSGDWSGPGGRSVHGRPVQLMCP